jgi:mannose-1-phosphate guanylyltransferase
MLQLAWERARVLLPAERILVCTGADYADTVLKQLPELPPENLLGEPMGRDSLNAAAWSSAVLAVRDPEAVLAVLTADQLIRPVDVFAARIRLGFTAVAANPELLVTFGIVPTAPATGFGYLHLGDCLPEHPEVLAVQEFKEKPGLALAEAYFSDGGYWWNSGMFVWRATTMLALLDQLVPVNAALIRELAAHPDRLTKIYPQLPPNSIDYAVMEPVSHGLTSARIAAVGMSLDWRDVGSYLALHEVLPQDEAGNASIGTVLFDDAQGTLAVNATLGTLAVSGTTGLVVVRTATATFVAQLADSERVKEIVKKVGVGTDLRQQ